jgi:hypothetical protein
MQLDYPLSIDDMVAGHVHHRGNEVIVTAKTAEDFTDVNHEVGPGVGVLIDSDGNAKKPNALQIKFDGVCVLNQARQGYTTSFEDGLLQTFEAKEPVAVIKKGIVDVIIESGITIAAGDPVYCRFRYLTQKISIVFDVDFVVGNTINGTVGGVAIAAVPFNTTHSQTISDLAGAIVDTGMTSFLSSNAGTRTIVITIDPDLDPTLGSSIGDYVSTTDFTVTGGVSQAVDTVTEQYAPSESTFLGGFRNDADTQNVSDTCLLLTRAQFTGKVKTVANSDMSLAQIEINYSQAT